jgi:Bacteriophage baseplate protein W
MAADDFIGCGWAFPVRADVKGNIALVDGVREVEESIQLILRTAYGERPMRPEFGCGIHDLTFAAVDATLAARIAYEVRASLRRWEPRIDVTDVTVHVDDDDQALLFIGVEYSIRRRNDPRNLVFPFYVIPGEGHGR